MRRWYPLLTLSLCLVLASDASANRKEGVPPSTEAIAPDAGDVNTTLAVILSTGFEAPTYVLGPAEPQNGWTASGVNLAWNTISNLNPAQGTQHLRVIRDVTVAGGSTRVLLSPVTALPPNTPAQFRGLLYISNDGGSDHDLIGQAPNQGFITYRMKFSWSDDAGTGPGTIYVLDDLGAGLGFVNTGVTWTEGQYKEVKVQHDPAAGEIRYFYDGALIYTGTIFAGTSVEQVGMVTDNFQLAGEHAGLDEIQLLDTPSDPTPASATTWGKIKGQYR